MSIPAPATSPAEQQLYDQIVRRIVEATDPERIILFGSRARRDHQPDSDLDLFIEMESELRPSERGRAIRSLFRPRRWPMDVFVYTPAEVARSSGVNGTLVSIVEREGKVLYERPAV